MTLGRRLLTGIGSLLALAVIIGGIPAALVVAGANPFRTKLPSWNDVVIALTTRDDGTFILGLFTAIAWLGWAILMASLLLEIVSRVGRFQAPRIPGLRLPQIAAKHLVAGVLVLFVSTPALAHAVPAPAPSTTSSAPAAAAAPAAPTQTPSDASGHVVTVAKGDSLSKIARDHLGDGNRWPELYEASKTTDQGHGVRLHNPNLIHPGWQITIPSPPAEEAASPRTDETPTAETSVTTESAEQAPPAPAVTQAPAVETTEEPAPATPQAPVEAPAQAAPAPAEAPQSIQSQIQQEDSEDPIPVRTAFGVGALLAAGVITLLGFRRRMQQHRRPFGASIALPQGEEAAVEQAVRAVADPLALEDIDQALRALSRDCVAAGESLPVVRAARLTNAQFELYLAEPQDLPAPWQSTSDTTVWFFESGSLAALNEEQLEGIAAPYPALVTLGHDAEDGHILVDLEYLGALAVAGNPETTREVLAAMAIELAVSRWADDITVTLVGAYSEMEDSLRTGRIRYLPNIERLIDNLEQRSTADQHALHQAGAASLNEARTRGVAPDSWTPEIVIVTGDLTSRQRNRLANLIDQSPRLAFAFVTTNGEPLNEWGLTVQDPSTAVLEPFGLTITPQRVTHDAYQRILAIMSTAQDTDGVARNVAKPESEPEAAAVVELDAEPEVEPVDAVDTASESDAVELDAEPDVEAAPDAVVLAAAALEGSRANTLTVRLGAANPHPYLRLLGPVELENPAGTVDPRRAGRLTEYLAYLLLNPGTTYAAIDEAMWPARSADKDSANHNTRGTATSRLRRWLGKNSADEDYFPPYSNYRISSDVRTDWDDFSELISDAAKASTTALEQGLSLVRGRPFKGVPVRRYAWAEMARQRMIAEISDASYELGHRRLLEGNWIGVEEAVAIGIEVDPGTERLWRLRILAAHQSGNDIALQEAVSRIEAFSEELGIGLDPETEDLLRALGEAEPFDALLKNLETYPMERTR